jgi:aminoglycoside phosphotransferase (APT) family kinase protein
LRGNAPVPKSEETAPVHRDFYDKQVLIGEKRVTLVDVDTLAWGDPALDLGNFLAHLYLRSRQHPEHQNDWRRARSVFVEEYRTVQTSAGDAEAVWQRVGWWETSALLRLAGLYSLRPRWKELAGPLLERAVANLEGKGDEND